MTATPLIPPPAVPPRTLFSLWHLQTPATQLCHDLLTRITALVISIFRFLGQLFGFLPPPGPRAARPPAPPEPQRLEPLTPAPAPEHPLTPPPPPPPPSAFPAPIVLPQPPENHSLAAALGQRLIRDRSPPVSFPSPLMAAPPRSAPFSISPCTAAAAAAATTPGAGTTPLIFNLSGSFTNISLPSPLPPYPPISERVSAFLQSSAVSAASAASAAAPETRLSLLPYLTGLLQRPPAEEGAPIIFPGDSTTAAHITFQRLLEETYGQALAQKVTKQHHLHTKQPLLWRDVKEILISVAAQVTRGDLRSLFEACRNPAAPASPLCVHYLDPDVCTSLAMVASFEALTPEQIAQLLTAFRTLPIGKNRLHILDALGSYNTTLPDVQFLTACRMLPQASNNPEPYRDAAVSELLAKYFAYLVLQPGMIIPLVSGSSGKLLMYEVAGKIDSGDGLISHLLTPLPRTGNPLHFHLLFRGTYDVPSAVRDTDFRGVGKTTFNTHAQELLRMVESSLSEENRVHLSIHGHSLGAADAQRATALLAETLASTQLHNARLQRAIAAVSCYAHNAPAPERELNRTFQLHITALEQKVPAVPFSINYLHFATDPVQQAGDSLLGAKITFRTLQRHVFCFDLPDARGVAAHSALGLIGGHATLPKLLSDRDSELDSYLSGTWRGFIAQRALLPLQLVVNAAGELALDIISRRTPAPGAPSSSSAS